MARSFSVVPADDGPDEWVDVWETDPGFWDDPSDDWEDPLAEVPRAEAERWREAARDHPSGKRRRPSRRDRGGWGPYPEP